MADILSFRDDPHQDIEMLLPWYASGQLEAEDAASVEAHLAACDPCRAMLEREWRLKAQVGALPIHPDLGWEKLQRRLAPDPRSRNSEAKRSPRPWMGVNWPAALIAFAGAQMAMLAFGAVLLRPPPATPDYRTLGAPTVRASGNILILFQPGTSLEDLRFALARVGARLVDGPTAAGAYVLDVEPARREAALADLRRQSKVMLAQPIDAYPPR